MKVLRAYGSRQPAGGLFQVSGFRFSGFTDDWRRFSWLCVTGRYVTSCMKSKMVFTSPLHFTHTCTRRVCRCLRNCVPTRQFLGFCLPIYLGELSARLPVLDFPLAAAPLSCSRKPCHNSAKLSRLLGLPTPLPGAPSGK